MRGKRVAIVIHPLHINGGAEFMLKSICKVFPDATIFTPWADMGFLKKEFPQMKVKTSFMQKLPYLDKYSKELVPLHPFAFRSFKFEGFNNIIILSDGFDKFLKLEKKHKVLLNIMTPPRFLWMDSRAMEKSDRWTYRIYKTFFKSYLHPLWKKQDKLFAKRANLVLSISKDVQKRVAKYYELNSTVLYPPVDLDSVKFNPMLENRENWYLYFGRLESYKGVELAIRAAIVMEKKLKVAGTGMDEARLKELVVQLGGTKYIEFLGYVSDSDKWNLYHKCKALIYPVKDEDFGIVPIEANGSGAPVIAFKGGGVLETVVENSTGVFFDEFTVESLTKAMSKLDSVGIDPINCQRQAEKFKSEIFETTFLTYVNNL